MHKAIVQWPYAGHRFGRNVSIEHSNIIVRGLKIDGRKLAWDTLRIGGNGVENVIVEDNWIIDGGHMAVGMFDTQNVIFRRNLIEDMGNYSEDGEGFYLSSANHNRPVSNVEIYGNVIRNVTANYIDFKGQARNVNVHHNIFEQHRYDKNGWCGDGLIRSEGRNSSEGNYFQDNIVRNSPDPCYTIRLTSNRVDVLNSVFRDVDDRVFIDSRTTHSAIIRENTLCHAGSGNVNRISNWSPNYVNRSQDDCDEEEARIIAESETLASTGFPVAPSGSLHDAIDQVIDASSASCDSISCPTATASGGHSIGGVDYFFCLFECVTVTDHNGDTRRYYLALNWERTDGACFELDEFQLLTYLEYDYEC